MKRTAGYFAVELMDCDPATTIVIFIKKEDGTYIEHELDGSDLFIRDGQMRILLDEKKMRS